MGITIDVGHYEKYFNGARLNKLVEQIKTTIDSIDFDTIAVCGISGLLVGAPLASVMGKRLLVVRKPSEPTRAVEEITRFGFDSATVEQMQNTFRVSGFGSDQKILLLDDHISSGVTMNFMVAAINRQCTNPSFRGVVLYAVPKWHRQLFGTPRKHTVENADGGNQYIPIITI